MAKNILKICVIISLILSGEILACDEIDVSEYDKYLVEILTKDTETSLYFHATGFLVRSYAITGKSFDDYIISNKHVINNNDSIFIRIKKKNGAVDTIPIGNNHFIKDSILYPKDISLDLAALPLERIDPNWDLVPIVDSLFEDENNIKKGTELFYLGFPSILSISEIFAPVYGNGFIALNSINKARMDDYGYCYIINAVIIGGFSGCPVFNCSGNLIGINSVTIVDRIDYPDHDEIIINPIKDSIDAAISSYSGFGGMIPIQYLNDLLGK